MTDNINFTSPLMNQALDFNTENIFEYMNTILQEKNANLYGEQADQTLLELCSYIKTLPLDNVDSVMLEVEDYATSALCQTSEYAFKAGFIVACKLRNTLQSF